MNDPSTGAGPGPAHPTGVFTPRFLSITVGTAVKGRHRTPPHLLVSAVATADDKALRDGGMFRASDGPMPVALQLLHDGQRLELGVEAGG